MPRQIERDDAAPVGQCPGGQCRLVEHPGVEVGAEPVHQHDRRPIGVTAARRYQGRAAAARQPRSRAAPASVRFIRSVGRGRFRRDKPRYKGVDLAVGHLGRRRHGEQRADRQGRARSGDDAAQDAGLARLEDVGDFRRLDFEQFLACPVAVALLFQPAEDLALGHRQTPFRHRDRGDVAHRQTSRCGRRPIARVFPAYRARAGEGEGNGQDADRLIATSASAEQSARFCRRAWNRRAADRRSGLLPEFVRVELLLD